MSDPGHRPAEPRAIDLEDQAELERLAAHLEATTDEVLNAVRRGFTNRTSLELYFAAPDA